MNKRFLVPALLLAAVTGLLAVVGHWLLFSTFMFYDDEGYVLTSLRNFSVGGGLYDRVFSQYGPFFFNLQDALHRLLGLPFDATGARWFTLVCWCGTALLGGIFAWRQTRSHLTALGAAALTFAYLETMSFEPPHPGGLLVLLVALGAVGGGWAIERGRPGWLAGGAGLLGGAMLLTKINVGVFFFAATGGWLLLNADVRPALRRNFLRLVALGCVLLPVALMWKLRDERWVRAFGLAFSCGALGWTLEWHKRSRPEHGLRSWAWLAGLGGALVTALLALTWWRGSSLSGLLHGIVLDPLRHPGVYTFAVEWRPGTPVVALGSLLVAAVAWRRADAPWLPPVLAGLRLVAGMIFLLGALKLGGLTLPRVGLSFGVALAWLLSVPLTPGPATDSQRARGWLTWVFVWQSLQAYPIAGSQVAWGTFLWAPLLVSGVYEAVVLLATYARATVLRFALWAGCLLGLAVAVNATTGQLARDGHARLQQYQPLNLPGAESLRLPDDFRTVLRLLNENLTAHAGTVFSFPGMFSFNLWADRPTPTLANVTHWFSLLSEAQQQAIITQLGTDPRACIVLHRFHLNYLHDRNFPTTGPLVDYIMREFDPVFTVDNYEFWVRHGRTIAGYSLASLAKGDAPNRRALGLVLQALPASAATVELKRLDPPYDVVQTLAFDAAQHWEITPLSPGGQTTGPSVITPATPSPAGPVRLTTQFTPVSGLYRTNEVMVVMRDRAGQVVAELRFAQ